MHILHLILFKDIWTSMKMSADIIGPPRIEQVWALMIILHDRKLTFLAFSEMMWQLLDGLAIHFGTFTQASLITPFSDLLIVDICFSMTTLNISSSIFVCLKVAHYFHFWTNIYNTYDNLSLSAV